MTTRQAIVAIALTVGVIAAAIVVFNVLVFRLVSVSPPADQYPSFAEYAEFTFSHNVKTVGSVKLNGNRVYGKLTIQDKMVRYDHAESFKKDSQSTLELIDVVSKSGQKIPSVSFVFSPRYIPFADLPKDVQERSIDKSSSGQAEDPFFNNYFPIVRDGYEIEYENNPATLEPSLYVTFLAEVYNYDTNQQTYLPNEEAEKMRDKVLAHIRSLGGTPDKYEIHYANPYLELKYNPSGEDVH